MVIADTGFWLALANRRDRFHHCALDALDAHGVEGFISTWSVVTETCYLLLNRVGAQAQERFLESHERGAFVIAGPEAHPVVQISPLMEKYRDLPMDLADASLVLLAEHLGHGRIVSTDMRDFGAYRWKRTRPFQNLLSEI